MGVIGYIVHEGVVMKHEAHRGQEKKAVYKRRKKSKAEKASRKANRKRGKK